MRFRAPLRTAVPAATFSHPAFAMFAAHLALLTQPAWPPIAELNERLAGRAHLFSGQPLHFVQQIPSLKGDGLHYERRIFDTGIIATRAESWHDLFNALMWLARFELKCAINAAYVRELARPCHQPRTRAQCALTHFDEGGAVVMLRDPTLLALWDDHDWPGLLWRERARWASGADLMLVGHAIFEHLLVPSVLPVAKCLVIAPATTTAHDRVSALAQRIVDGELLADPQALRPLPLAGLAGWHADSTSESFYREAACFRSRRAGRLYPPITDIN
ncbi:MAG: DUF3025 domain-containing protein [Gammaproteobacteria bacterium]|nr:DUF3025 domain-containing protein [Gammaproteobacteria bacterium]